MRKALKSLASLGANIIPLSLFTVGLPLTATAAAVSNFCQVLDKFFVGVQYFGSAILIVAVAMLLYAGFLFITGGGNEETLKKAKTVLIFALIGLAVAILATSADDIIKNIVGGEFVANCPTKE